MAEASGIAVLRTAYRAPRENALCARFLGSVRRECPDHLLVLSEAHLRRILRAYVAYFNGARPPQGVRQQVPDEAALGASRRSMTGGVHAVPVLGDLHQA